MMEDFGEKLQLRQLMVKISQRLSDTDLRELKYLCGDSVPELALERVKVPTDLFTVLQHHGYLSAKCYKFLKGCLLTIGRHDLALLLPSSQEVSVQNYNPVTAQPLCQLQHRRMLVHVVERMQTEDIVKLAYITTGKVYGSDVNTITALQIITELKDYTSLCQGNYASLCDLLRSVGRSDLADLVSGFPRSNPQGFSMENQAFHLMMEVLRNKKTLYALHHSKLKSMKEGNDAIVQHIHSQLLETGLKGLNTRSTLANMSSILLSLQNAFKSQYEFMQCTVEFQSLKHKELFDFINNSFGCDDDSVVEHYPCPVAESAHQARKFILEVSCEIIGKEKTVEVLQLNYKIERGINICSKYAKHITSLLGFLSTLLSLAAKREVDLKPYQKELTDIFVSHEKYITAIFPFIGIRVENLSTSLLNTIPWNTPFQGAIAMIVIPSYVILLNLIATSYGHPVNSSEDIFRRLVDYLCLSCHLSGTREFVQKCAASLQDNVVRFRSDIIELDGLCAPLIRELVCV